MNGAGVTSRVTFTACGVFVAPGADTEIVLVYVPGARPALLTETVRVALPEPPAGATDNHAGAVALAVAVQSSVPAPMLDNAITWFAGLVPWTVVKESALESIRMVGATGLSEITSAHDRSTLGKPPGEAPVTMANRGLLRVCVTLPREVQRAPSSE